MSGDSNAAQCMVATRFNMKEKGCSQQLMIAYCFIQENNYDKEKGLCHSYILPCTRMTLYTLTPHVTSNALVIESVNFTVYTYKSQALPKSRKVWCSNLRNIICHTGETYSLIQVLPSLSKRVGVLDGW